MWINNGFSQTKKTLSKIYFNYNLYENKIYEPIEKYNIGGLFEDLIDTANIKFIEVYRNRPGIKLNTDILDNIDNDTVWEINYSSLIYQGKVIESPYIHNKPQFYDRKNIKINKDTLLVYSFIKNKVINIDTALINEFGNPIKTNISGTGNTNYYFYNRKGILKKTKTLTSSGNETSLTFKIRLKDKYILITDLDDRITSKFDYSGRIIEEIIFKSYPDTIWNRKVYKYENGKKTEQIVYNERGMISSKFVYYYDNDMQLILVSEYNPCDQKPKFISYWRKKNLDGSSNLFSIEYSIDNELKCKIIGAEKVVYGYY